MHRQDNVSKIQRLTVLAMLTALAMLLSYVESLIPFHFAVPGMKLGLANAAIMTTLYLYDFKAAAAVSFMRVVLVSFMFSNMFTMIYSLCGAVLSLAVMGILKKTGRFSLTGVSVAGGVAHNVGQIGAAVVLLDNVYIAGYLPVLIISGLVTGVLIGIISAILVSRLTKAFHFTHNGRGGDNYG